MENQIPPHFSIDIPVRISDINYGGHLGHAELIKITHQARLKYFATQGLSEMDLDGAGVIVKHLEVDYQGEAFFDELLHIAISMEIQRSACVFSYRITKQDKAVATVRETVLFMNYTTRKVVRVPAVMHLL